MNLWKLFTHLPRLLIDAKLLESDVQQAREDPELLAEIERSPIIKARLQNISAEWRQVENDLGGTK